MRAVPEFFIKFAEEYRFKITRDDCDDPVILGKFGHFYVWDEVNELLGICLLNERKDGWPLKTAHKKNQLMRMRPKKCDLEGDVEGIWVTDVHDHEFIQAAAKVIRVKPMRRYSEEYRQVLRERLKGLKDHKTEDEAPPEEDHPAEPERPLKEEIPSSMPIVDSRTQPNSGIRS